MTAIRFGSGPEKKGQAISINEFFHVLKVIHNSDLNVYSTTFLYYYSKQKIHFSLFSREITKSEEFAERNQNCP